jgi:hypothetical protein
MQPERLSIWGQQMTGYGPALRRRMRAMGMVELRVDHVVDGIQTHCETRHQACRRQTNGQTQTCVSRTFGVAHQNLARLVHVSLFHVSCFMNVFRRAAALSRSFTKFGVIVPCFMFHVSGTCSGAPPIDN